MFGVSEQQCVFVQNARGHREAGCTECSEVGPAVDSIHILVPVDQRRQNKSLIVLESCPAKKYYDSPEVEKQVSRIFCEVLGQASTEQVVHAC